MDIDQNIIETLQKQLNQLEQHLEEATIEYNKKSGQETYASAKASRRVRLLKNVIEELKNSIHKLSEM